MAAIIRRLARRTCGAAGGVQTAFAKSERRGRDVDVIVGARPEEIAELRAVLLAVERRAADD